MPATIIRPSERRLVPVKPSADAGVTGTSSIQRQIVCDDTPYVHIVEVAAGHRIPAHSHSQPEVTVILSGSARIGGTLCEAGTVVSIPADEAYSIEAGPGALTMVVVRPAASSYRWAAPGEQ